jgi:hypothetical protein
MLTQLAFEIFERLNNDVFPRIHKVYLSTIKPIGLRVLSGLAERAPAIATVSKHLWHALRNGFWRACALALKLRVLVQTRPTPQRLAVLLRLLLNLARIRGFTGPSAFDSTDKYRASQGALIAAIEPCLSCAYFSRSLAFDSLLTSLFYIKGPTPWGLYFRLEGAAKALLKTTPPLQNSELSGLGAAVAFVFCAVEILFTVLFFFGVIATFNLALIANQALSTVLAPLAKGAIRYVWKACLRALSLTAMALNFTLILASYILIRFAVVVNFCVVRAKKVWPLYTDELGRSYFRRTTIGGILALSKTCASSAGSLLKEVLGAVGILILTTIIFLLPTDILTRGYTFYSAMATCATLKVFIKVRPKV